MALERIVVFTGDLNYGVRKNVVEIDRVMPGLTWLIVIHRPKRTLRHVLLAQWRNLKTHGWRRIPVLALALRQRLRAPVSEPALEQYPGSAYATSALKAAANVRIVATQAIHAPEVLREVTAFDPDLGLSLAAPILRRNLFSIPKLGTINLHKGKVPDYRGMPPAFWELWNDEESVGCTVHWVRQKLDSGPIVATASIKRERYSTVRGLQLCLDEVGGDLMREAVANIARGVSRFPEQTSGGRTYRKPTLAQEAELARKLASRAPLPPRARLPTRLLKDAIKRTASITGSRMVRGIWTPRVTVLLYHRVTDEVRDNLTVGIEQFDRQMALLRRHAQVISIENLLSVEVAPRTDKPLVCVTFDDGYLDNCVNAAPILLRHGIPAAFFVATGIIGTDGRFPHDIRRGNPPISMMRWEHIRQMYEAGFTIGSHSVSHIDCAAEPVSVVRTELAQSREDLCRTLGLQHVIFAYPYGGPQHMTPDRLELVKEAGYIGCLSAYGGSNVGRIERFNVLRRGIHWEFSDTSFLYESLGL
jgi:peptidoglycan/xylan/chitin deacetylase (PgdA/CDA1 family)/folate-dependent phosphoribosylglycinamide formyltransferase PurN